MEGHIPLKISDMSSPHPVRRMFNPDGVGVIAFVVNPGCAACASTLGFVVERLQRKQKFGRRPAAGCLVATGINQALTIRTVAITQPELLPQRNSKRRFEGFVFIAWIVDCTTARTRGMSIQ
jgi:hypothetical protein